MILDIHVISQVYASITFPRKDKLVMYQVYDKLPKDANGYRHYYYRDGSRFPDGLQPVSKVNQKCCVYVRATPSIRTSLISLFL